MLFRCGTTNGGGSLVGNITLIDAKYNPTTNKYYTYTFTQNIDTCLVVDFSNTGEYTPTYTGSGTVTTISLSTGNPFLNTLKIINVKNGDTIKFGRITVADNTRHMYGIFSIT